MWYLLCEITAWHVCPLPPACNSQEKIIETAYFFHLFCEVVFKWDMKLAEEKQRLLKVSFLSFLYEHITIRNKKGSDYKEDTLRVLKSQNS